MRIGYVFITMLLILSLISCSSTGVMGLATEEAVVAKDTQHDQEILELQNDIKKIQQLTDRLEAVLTEAQQVRSNAKEALIISRETAAESLKLAQKIESVKSLLDKIDTKVETMPKESIEKLIQILERYVEENEAP